MTVRDTSLSMVMNTAELMHVFGYGSPEAVRRAINENNFPVHTFRIGVNYFAHPEVVFRWLEAQRVEGMHQLHRDGVVEFEILDMDYGECEIDVKHSKATDFSWMDN